VIARIVRALPPSLLHLEIDTEGVDRISDDDIDRESDDHLCSAISERLPHLETLWLRVSCLCGDLFNSLSRPATPQVTSELRRVFIRMNTDGDRARYLRVSPTVHNCATPRDQRTEYQAVPDTLSMDRMMVSLLGLQAAGAFPRLQRCIVWYEAQIPNKSETYYRVRDIATRTTTQYPKARAWSLQGFDLPVYPGVNTDQLFMIKDHNGRDWLGDLGGMEQALLHEVAWKESENGVRLPPSGRLEFEQTRPCEDDLFSMDTLREQEAEQMASGALEEPKLPNPPGWNVAKVFVKEL